MKRLHSPTQSSPLLLLLLLLAFFSPIAHGRHAKENRRDFQKFDTPSLKTLTELGPEQWNKVDEGHLGKLLIPRAGTSVSSIRPGSY